MGLLRQERTRPEVGVAELLTEYDLATHEMTLALRQYTARVADAEGASDQWRVVQELLGARQAIAIEIASALGENRDSLQRGDVVYPLDRARHPHIRLTVRAARCDHDCWHCKTTIKARELYGASEDRRRFCSRCISYEDSAPSRPLSDRPDERAEEMARLYVEERETLDQIGRRFGITRERVRQILSKYGVDRGEVAQRRNAARRAAEDARIRDSVLEAFGRLRSAGLVADELRLSVVRVSRILSAEIPDWRDRIVRTPPVTRTSDEEYMQYLREAAKECEPLSIAAYNEIAAKYGWPGHQMYPKRFGGWAKACQKAGVQPGGGAERLCGPRSDRRWHFDLCVDALRRCAAELGRPVVSAAEYESWARGRADAPALATVRNRATWNETKDAAFFADKENHE